VGVIDHNTGGNASLVYNYTTNSIISVSSIGNGGKNAIFQSWVDGTYYSPITWNTVVVSTDDTNANIYISRGNVISGAFSTVVTSYPGIIDLVTNRTATKNFFCSPISSSSLNNAFTVDTSPSGSLPADTSGLTVGDEIYFGGTAFGGVSAGFATPYYINSILSTSEFTISTTFGGPDFTLTTDTGTMYVLPRSAALRYSTEEVVFLNTASGFRYLVIDTSGTILYDILLSSTPYDRLWDQFDGDGSPSYEGPNTGSEWRYLLSKSDNSQLAKVIYLESYFPGYITTTENIVPTITPNATTSHIFCGRMAIGDVAKGPTILSCSDEDVANNISNTYVVVGDPNFPGPTPGTWSPSITTSYPTYLVKPEYSSTGIFIGIQNQGNASTGADTKIVFSNNGTNWITTDAVNLSNGISRFASYQVTGSNPVLGTDDVRIINFISSNPTAGWEIPATADNNVYGNIDITITRAGIVAGYQHSNGVNTTSLSTGTYKSLGTIGGNTYMFIRTA
jgi:hypothetical protein